MSLGIPGTARTEESRLYVGSHRPRPEPSATASYGHEQLAGRPVAISNGELGPPTAGSKARCAGPGPRSGGFRGLDQKGGPGAYARIRHVRVIGGAGGLVGGVRSQGGHSRDQA